MGPIAARKAREVVRHTRTVLAIEILSACQALDLVAPLAPSRGVAAALAAVRGVVPHLDDDRVLSPDIAAIETMMLDGPLRAAVEQATGVLQ
jgi:histidine ammonia-lyase